MPNTISRLVLVVRANEQIPAKGKCFCPLAEADEQVQESHEEQEVGPPGPDDWDAAASHQDGDQRHPPVLPPPPEELIPQTVEDLPEDIVRRPPHRQWRWWKSSAETSPGLTSGRAGDGLDTK